MITRAIRAAGYSAIVFVALIFYFLLREGLPTLQEVQLSDLFALRWYPIEKYFGILPLISGSIIVTLGATLIAVPFGIGTAIFISEIAPRWAREILKPPGGTIGWPTVCCTWIFRYTCTCALFTDFTESTNRLDRFHRFAPTGCNCPANSRFGGRRCP